MNLELPLSVRHDSPWYAHDARAVLAAFSVGLDGLSAAEAADRLRQYGPNRLTPRPGPSALRRFLLQFHNVLIYVLLGAAAITAALQNWVDTGVIVGVVVINAVIGFIQEGKAEQALAAIRRMLSLKATVLRDGHQITMAAEELVPGDVAIVQSGDRVPADLRLLRVKNLRLDEASLTGESMPVEKQAEPVAGDAALADRRSMAYSGALVTYGQGRGVVVATADHTEIGRISELLARVERLETPLLRKLRGFSKSLSLAILAIAAATFAIGVGLRGYHAVDMFMAAVGLAVAAIPEGLPAIITITLAIGVQRMARRHTIIRVLPAVEALGSVTCICTDKTGTLTRNEMTVQSIETGDATFAVSGGGYEPRGEFLLDGRAVNGAARPELFEVLRAGLLCNDASLRRDGGSWRIEGDPTEAALVVAAAKAGLDHPAERELRPRLDVIPFESEHRFMATLHHDHAGHHFIYVKGAPERVLEMCAFERSRGEDRPLRHDDWQRRIERLGAQGQRVLACAYRPAGPGRQELQFADVSAGLILLGIFGMVDPPREEAILAVAACRAAGIRVKMITGDHALTAGAIAARLGIGDGQRIMTGAQLEHLDAAALRAAVVATDVYARVSPEHKLKLVEALQARGEIVAMTGDGVNDAPALKRADVGVAMGVAGTEAAKEAAAMVLADDNFASIVNAIEEGRTVYDNLRKTLLFILPTNVGQAFTLVAAIALGMALPILPVQILWVNLVVAVTLALALAFEPAESEVMRRPPRAPGAPIFPGYFVWRTLFVAALLVAGTLAMFVWEQHQGAAIEAARTAAVNTLVLAQGFYLLSARRLSAASWPHIALRGNVYVPLTLSLVVMLQLLYTYAPPMHGLFHTAPLAFEAWLRIVGIGVAVYFAVEVEKGLLRRWRGRGVA